MNNNCRIPGTYYEENLRPCHAEPTSSKYWLIDEQKTKSRNKTKKIRGVTYIEASFLFYPSSYDEFVPLSAFEKAWKHD
jgi:hypothetical protein